MKKRILKAISFIKKIFFVLLWSGNGNNNWFDQINDYQWFIGSAIDVNSQSVSSYREGKRTEPQYDVSDIAV